MGYISPLRATVSHLVEQPAAWDEAVVAALARTTRARARAYLGQLVADKVLEVKRVECLPYGKGTAFPIWINAVPHSRPRRGKSRWIYFNDDGQDSQLAYELRIERAEREARLRLAKALRDARAVAGLSITRLAWASKVDRKTIIRLGHAHFDATQRTRDRLSQALGVRL